MQLAEERENKVVDEAAPRFENQTDDFLHAFQVQNARDFRFK